MSRPVCFFMPSFFATIGAKWQKVDIVVALFIKHFILCSRKYGVELISQCSPTSNYSMKLHTIAWILIIIGALNWGLVGLGGLLGGNWNVVSMILGS